MEKILFSKNVDGIAEIYHEILLLMKFLQTKPQVMIMNIKYYDLFYTVIKNGNEREITIGKVGENDFISFTDIIINHHIGIKNINEVLK